MSEEVTVRILFPQTNLNVVEHNFNIDKEVTAILEYAIQCFPDKVLPSSQIYVSNDQHLYDFISPETKINDLKYSQQQQMLVVPESYSITIQDPLNRTISMSIKSNFLVREIVRTVCVQSQLLDPRFYVMTAKNVVLDQDGTFAAQAPFASQFNLTRLETDQLCQLLQSDFISGTLSCTDKDIPYVMASFLLKQNGPYKSSDTKQVLEAELAKFVPRSIQEPKKFISDAVSTYKKLKATDSFTNDFVDYLLNYIHFMSIVVNAERYQGLIGKKPSKDKVTISLGYSVLKFYKQNSTNFIDQYNLTAMRNLQMEGLDSFKFEYDTPKGPIQVRCQANDEMQNIFNTIVGRLKSPGAKRGSDTRGSSDSFASVAIPSFAQLFSYYSEIPRFELSQITTRVIHLLLSHIKTQNATFVMDFQQNKQTDKSYFQCVRLTASICRLIDEQTAMNLYTDLENLTTADANYYETLSEREHFAQKVMSSKASKSEQKTFAAQMQTLNQKSQDAHQELENAIKKFTETLLKAHEHIGEMIEEKSQFVLRPLAISCIRSILYLLFVYYWINEMSDMRSTIQQIKDTLLQIIADFENINCYSVEYKTLTEHFAVLVQLSKDAITHANSYDPSEPTRQYLIITATAMHDEVEKWNKELLTYFEKNPPKELSKPLDKIEKIVPDETRQQLKLSHQILEELSGNIDNLNEAEDKLKKLSVFITTILGMAPESTHEPCIIAFNEVRIDVERSFVKNGMYNASASCERCTAALDAAFQSVNPANDLRQQLTQFPIDDARVLALLPIVDYLDQNGPLYQGSSTQVDIQRFIMQMTLAKTETLVEIAFTVESHVPENLRHLTEVCDPTKDLYPEVDGEMDIHQLATQAKQSSLDAVNSAQNIRQNVREFERECSKKYRTLNTQLWRVMNIFRQYAIDEDPGTVGHKTFEQCREAFRILIEETAFDMKRDRSFLPFIQEFTDKVMAVTESPRRPKTLGALCVFLLSQQTRQGFYEAARALADFTHFVLCEDSNKAARKLVEDSQTEYEFRTTTMMISQLKNRLINVKNKVDLSMKAKTQIDIRKSHVDLRSDFATFITKFNENIFFVFTQMVAMKIRNIAAIQQLATGVEAIEKDLPLVMSIEYSAPYFSRSVCGIVLYSMDQIINTAKEMNSGKTVQCTNDAQLAVREFLFMIRRKVAEADEESNRARRGIGIPDMQAVIDRETKAMNAAADFQRSIRKRQWTVK